MSNSFPQIRAAAIDERAHNVFYRLTQLERLCKTLIDSALTLQEAITADYGHSQAEVSMELNLTISAVKRDYSLLQPKMILDEEYSIAYGKDAPLHRKAAGIVYIEPTTHTLLYSAIIPLSAAIAAGNCVILLVRMINEKDDVVIMLTERCSSRITFAPFLHYCDRYYPLHLTKIHSPSPQHRSKRELFSILFLWSTRIEANVGPKRTNFSPHHTKEQ